MPGYKHPCPYCGKFIEKTVAACPFCSQVDPFAPRRCGNCSKIIDDPAWVTCPSCGNSLVIVAADASSTPVAGSAPSGASAGATPGATPGAPAAPAIVPPAPRPALYQDPAAPSAPAAAPAGPCSGCGAPLPAGARFCTVCGTVAGQ